MLCFEWWCFELLAIFSGLISVEALAAEVIIVNIVTLIFMIPLGTGYAASAFTGYFLGQGKIDKAKYYSRLTLAFNTLLTIVVIILLATLREEVSMLFTQDAKIVKIIKDVMFILSFYIFFDTIHGVQSGIIRGLGLQVYGSVWTLICYYLIGLPAALWLAFGRDKGVFGLWLGFSIACVILDLGFLVIIECPNWHNLSVKIQEQIDQEKTKKITESIKARKRLADENFAGATATPESAKTLLRKVSLQQDKSLQSNIEK